MGIESMSSMYSEQPSTLFFLFGNDISLIPSATDGRTKSSSFLFLSLFVSLYGHPHSQNRLCDRSHPSPLIPSSFPSKRRQRFNIRVDGKERSIFCKTMVEPSPTECPTRHSSFVLVVCLFPPATTYFLIFFGVFFFW